MNFSIKIGRISGIEVRVHWTLLVVSAVLLLFPDPPQSLGVLAWRLGGITLVFGSVLLHEFGHAFAGRFCDGQCDTIILWPLGGLAFVSLPDSPIAHFLTAIAGPLVTLVLWTGAHFTAPTIQYPPLLGCVSLMATVNGAILLFNLIPAFPLDGGRMLQAVLWRRMGYARSMWVCVHIAMVAAVSMVAFAVVLFAGNDGALHISLIAAAIFIFIMAWRERQILKVEMENTEFWDSRPGVAWNHPYRTYEERHERRSTKRKGFLANLSVRQDKPADGDEELDPEAYISKEVDPILDKISREGLQSLTARERRILEQARQKMEKKSR